MNHFRSTLFVVLIGIAGCDSTSPPPNPAADPAPAAAPQPVMTEPQPSADTQASPVPQTAECTAKGGAIRKVCRMQKPACVIPYPDAGQRCTDKSQCKGLCIVDSEKPLEDGAAAQGRCQVDDDPCGCKIEVRDGKVAGGRCVD